MYEDELSRVTLKAETLKKVKKFFGDEIPKEKKKAAEDLCLRMTEVLYMMIMLEEDVQKNGIKTPNGNTANGEYKTLFNLAAGINKIRIYGWVEGQDYDCENNASGSNITYNIQISKNATA